MSHVYPLAKQAFESGTINLPADTIRIVFLSSAYTYSPAHQFYSDLGGIIGTASGALGTKTVVQGVFDAADITLVSVPTGNTITQIAGYKDTGTTTTSPLIWVHDGLNQATNGGDIQVQWNASGIFAL
jgi:hypothetical protein